MYIVLCWSIYQVIHERSASARSSIKLDLLSLLFGSCRYAARELFVVFAFVPVHCTCTVPVSCLLWLAVTGVYLNLSTLFAIYMRLNDIRDGIALLHFVRDVICSALLLSSGLCLSVRSLFVISYHMQQFLPSIYCTLQLSLYSICTSTLYCICMYSTATTTSTRTTNIYCSSSISLHFASCSYRISASSRIASYIAS